MAIGDMGGAQARHSGSPLKVVSEECASGPAEKESNVQPQDFPEGGLTAWATAIGACVHIFPLDIPNKA